MSLTYKHKEVLFKAMLEIEESYLSEMEEGDEFVIFDVTSEEFKDTLNALADDLGFISTPSGWIEPIGC
jgi:hypothetical protein